MKTHLLIAVLAATMATVTTSHVARAQATRAPNAGTSATSAGATLMGRVTDGYANSNGVKIHYAALGDPAKPLVVLIHGFPDFWYTWRNQMDALARDHYVVAMDQRGYNLSDKPKGAEQYDMALLVGDVLAVIRSAGREKAIVVGHDWGGAVAWAVATTQPQAVEKLVILNLPHIRALRRELVNNPVQAKNSQYARTMQLPGAGARLTAEGLAGWVANPEAKAKYVEAFRRSDFDAMAAYYQRNYPREPYTLDETPVVKVQAPVLMIHGLKDPFLLAGALNGSWEFVERELTLVTIPTAGHFVQHDAAEQVTRTIVGWIDR
ncbi:MAG: alpha/beta hydrolase [Gemmatimonadetes bacterium]|nr:alpha/beta hydrolase [Gemmatimonadota bacterium]